MSGPRAEWQGSARLDRRREGPALTATGEQRVVRAVTRAFAPLDKAALGVAVGIVTAVALAAATLLDFAVDPAGRAQLGLLREYFYGYSVSLAGAACIAAWGFAVGFVAGWFTAFVRNAVMALWILYIRARAEWRATRDFLDYI